MNKLYYEQKNKIFFMFVVFALTATARIVLSFYTLPLGTISDHTSLYYVAANLAGYDWNDVVSNAGCYGIGFFFIFFPLYKMNLSPITIQIIMNLVIGIMVGIGSIIAYCIVNKNFTQMSQLEKVSLALIGGSSLIVNSYAPEGGNDFILTICLLIVFYFLLELLTDKSTHIRDNVGLLLVMGYSLTIHTRALLIYICLIITAIIYYCCAKKKLVYFWFWPVYIIEYFAVKLLLNTYRYTIWKGTIRNNSLVSGVAASSSMFKFDIYSLKAIMNTGIGIIITESSLTCGTFILALCAIMAWFYNTCIKKKTFNDKIIFSSIFNILGFLSLSFGLGISWLKSIYPALITGTLNWDDSYRAFTYCRYAAPFVPPIVILGVSLIIQNKELIIKICRVTLIVAVSLLIYFIYFILPYVQNHTDRYFLLRMMIDRSINTDINIWYGNLLGVLSPIVFTSLFLFFNNKKIKFLIISLIITLYVNFERVEIFINLSSKTEVTNYEKANAGFELLSNIQDELESEGKKDVYVFDKRDVTDSQIWYIYQFLNYKLHIIPTLPKTIGDECIVFTNGIVDSIYLDGFVHAQLDENEYVYCRGEKYIDILERAGVILNEEW